MPSSQRNLVREKKDRVLQSKLNWAQGPPRGTSGITITPIPEKSRMFLATLKERTESLGQCLARTERLGESSALLCAGAGELSLHSSSSHRVPCLPRKVGPCRPSCCSLICMAAPPWRPLWLSTQHGGLSSVCFGCPGVPRPSWHPEQTSNSLCSENPGLFHS